MRPSLLLSMLFLATLLTVSFLFPGRVYPDELEDINKQIAELTEELNNSVKATKPLESQLDSMKKQVAGIKAEMVRIDVDLVKKKKDIEKGYERLEEKQAILSQTVRAYYIKSYQDSPFLTFLESASASEMTRSLAYQRAKTNQDKTIIANLALTITDLEAREQTLKREQERLAVLRKSLDEQSAKLDDVIAGAKSYQNEVSGKIASLSQKQQEILSAKSGNFTFTVGSGELADEYLSSIKGFNESAPGGFFGVFSFGAYTHRNGMSQYGAKARAESGQSVEDILKAYYPNATLKKDYAVMGSITVNGHGSMPFEDQYLHGIYEMPGTWHSNALKAQVIAARTYAIKHTNNGQGSICTDEGCQVFKNERKGGAWEQAVNETKGWVLVDGGGNPVSTQYASTHGGFTNTAGWDTTDGSGGSNFIDKSYEKIGGSPWLYKAWWRQHYSNSGATCGRSNPWLSSQEMADIINAARFRDDRVTPVTTSCWGGNPYSMDELRQKANGPSSVSSVSVVQGNGATSEVRFQTNIGEITLSGAEFKEAFNLRAPGYVRIPQTGFAFFNIEHK